MGILMSARSAGIRLGREARRFARDGRATAAMEFAIIAPTMLAFAFGGMEICNSIAIERKVTSTARAVSDIVAQGISISDSEMANVLSAGKAMMHPYPTTGLKIRVSAVNIDNNGKATVGWSDANPAGDARGVNSAITINPALAVPNTQLILGEVAYDYKPNTPWGAIKSVWSFKYENNQFYARPRESTTVCRPPTVPCT
jgi:Flp pilus assembly protein TadG